MAPFLTVDSNTLLIEGKEILLKGFNLEIYGGSDHSIWPGYNDNKARIERLMDAARNPMKANTIRVVFPKGSVACSGNGEVLPEELDKLSHFLGVLAVRGMGAIVTIFNREDYAEPGRREGDKAKVGSFLRRFGQDPRVLMWDLVNEPPMSEKIEGGNVRVTTLSWLNDLVAHFRAFRDPLGRPAQQPLTIGVDWHHALTVKIADRNELRSIIELSDIVSFHCYGRFNPPATPVSDEFGVNYRDEKFLGAVLHWISRATARDCGRDKPIVLEEFGWPDQQTRCWPPGTDPHPACTDDAGPHPWEVYAFPATPESMDQLYTEMLGVIDRDNPVPPNPKFGKCAGAIQWTLQDAFDNETHHHFGIMTTDETIKRMVFSDADASEVSLAAGQATTTLSAAQAFANWGGEAAWALPVPPIRDAAFVSQTVPTFMLAGNTYPVTVTMRNTGPEPWRPGRHKLGSQEPADNLRWGLNRVDVPGEIPSEADAVFAFNVVAPMMLDEPATFRWKMVRENLAWFGERNTHVAVTVAKGAQFVAQRVPAAMVAGTTQTVSITMRNISGETWARGAGYKLGSQCPENNTNWGTSRVELPHDVPTGTEVTFSFEVRAPVTVGHHNFQWRMVRDGVGWLGQKTLNVEMRVMPPLTKAAVFVSQSVPNPMPPGSTRTVSVTMRNVGTATWTPGEQYALGSQNPMNNTRWGTNRVALPHEVPPNGEVTFSFPVWSHSTEGFMNFQWQLAQEGVGWFGQVTPNVEVRIAYPLRGALFVRQSVPSSMTLGTPGMASITMRNTGQDTWAPAGQYKLGSQNPADNGSWGTKRVAVPHDVPPNTEVTFVFPMAATTRGAEKNFQWKMVLDGVAWFGQTTPNVVVRVR